eukprot:2595698-Ditylum_brightwellii.AAC.1
MAKVQSSDPYTLVCVDDKEMGITATDHRARANARERWVNNLGLGSCSFGMLKYQTPGAASNFVMVFKVNPGNSSGSERIVATRAHAQTEAPLYYSWLKSADAIRLLQALVGANTILSETLLKTLLL